MKEIHDKLECRSIVHEDNIKPKLALAASDLGITYALQKLGSFIAELNTHWTHDSET